MDAAAAAEEAAARAAALATAPEAPWLADLPLSRAWWDAVGAARRRPGSAEAGGGGEPGRGDPGPLSAPLPPPPERAAALLARFLTSDLSRWGRATLSSSLARSRHARLPARVVLQVDEAFDASAPLSQRGGAAPPGASATCKLLLTDGHVRLPAVELTQLSFLRDGRFRPGCKLRLEHAELEGGVVLLTERCCTLLGGGVPALEMARTRLAQFQDRSRQGRQPCYPSVEALRDALQAVAWGEAQGQGGEARNAAATSPFSTNTAGPVGPTNAAGPTGLAPARAGASPSPQEMRTDEPARPGGTSAAPPHPPQPSALLLSPLPDGGAAPAPASPPAPASAPAQAPAPAPPPPARSALSPEEIDLVGSDDDADWDDEG